VEYDLGELTLEETLVPLDAEVSVHGTWSEARGAMVSDPASGGGRMTFGPPEQLPGVHSFARYVSTAILLTLIGGGLLWFGGRWSL
jgi:hypothetical protein